MSNATNKSPHPPLRAPAAGIFGGASPSREQVAEFLFANQAQVLRGIRGEIGRLEAGSGGRGSLAHLNTDDLLGTVIVRIDRAVLRGLVRTDSEDEFWAYVRVTGANAVLELLRSNKHSGPSGSEIREVMPASSVPPEVRSREAGLRVTALLETACTDSERRLLCFKARGFSYATIAAATGGTQGALRKQWSKLCGRLRDRGGLARNG